MSSTAKKPHHQPSFYRRKRFLVPLGSLLCLIIALLIAFRLSPWPGALVIRTVFNRGGAKTLAAMQASLPTYPVTVLSNQQYRPHDKAAFLDVYIPKAAGSDTQLPVIVWTHGGAWLSGDKKDAAPYYSRLADQGFVVVAVNYTLAPEKAYPYAVRQLNDAHAYILAQAARFHANTQKIVLAGDSAGAQISSQLAALITNPVYAREVDIQPALAPEQLAAVTLFCGIYQMEGLAHPNPTLPKIVGWGDDVAVWAYSGKRDNQDDAIVRQMSAYYHATKNFPPTFITGGNADPLTDAQSKPFADKLTSLGVGVTPLFYDQNHQPGLPHEYQFTFNADGERAFARTVQFMQEKTK